MTQRLFAGPLLVLLTIALSSAHSRLLAMRS